MIAEMILCSKMIYFLLATFFVQNFGILNKGIYNVRLRPNSTTSNLRSHPLWAFHSAKQPSSELKVRLTQISVITYFNWNFSSNTYILLTLLSQASSSQNLALYPESPADTFIANTTHLPPTTAYNQNALPRLPNPIPSPRLFQHRRHNSNQNLPPSLNFYNPSSTT
jgi:hypothetical protein